MKHNCVSSLDVDEVLKGGIASYSELSLNKYRNINQEIVHVAYFSSFSMK